MTEFLTGSAIFGLIALVFIMWPLLRRPAQQGKIEQAVDIEANVQVFRNRLAELEQEKIDGRIDEAEYAAVKLDLERGLVSDTNVSSIELSGNRKPLAALVLTALVIVVTIFIYAEIGNLKAFDPAPTEQQQAAAPDIEKMVSGLAQRLKENPDDVTGWQMLGRSYRVLNRPVDAAAAYERAYTLTEGNNPEILIDFAEALALGREDGFSGQPRDLLKRALDIEPGNRKGLWYAGIAAFDDQDYRAAIDHWNQLKNNNAPPEVLDALDKQIAKAYQLLGETPPAEAESQQSATTNQSADTARIIVKVSVASALQSQISGDEVLLIYAKAKSGPPMPLAIIRRTASELPGEFELNDGQAMVAGMMLSAHNEWTLQARITQSGQAIPQAGDLFGEVSAQKGAESANIIIDRVVP